MGHHGLGQNGSSSQSQKDWERQVDQALDWAERGVNIFRKAKGENPTVERPSGGQSSRGSYTGRPGTGPDVGDSASASTGGLGVHPAILVGGGGALLLATYAAMTRGQGQSSRTGGSSGGSSDGQSEGASS